MNRTPRVAVLGGGSWGATVASLAARNTETVLVDTPIASGDLVVTEGVQAVREGGDVMIARGGGAVQPADAPAGS